MVEKDSKHKVKVIRGDKVGEYVNTKLKVLCLKTGIQQHFTISYTPQRNGKAEKLNRTLLSKVRCMLLAANAPKELWAEALSAAV